MDTALHPVASTSLMHPPGANASYRSGAVMQSRQLASIAPSYGQEGEISRTAKEAAASVTVFHIQTVVSALLKVDPSNLGDQILEQRAEGSGTASVGMYQDVSGHGCFHWT